MGRATIDLSNLGVSDCMGNFSGLLAGTKLSGTINLMEVLSKSKKRHMCADAFCQGVEFDNIVMSGESSRRLNSCVNFFKKASGNSVKFIDFDFSRIGSFKLPNYKGYMRGMFEFANIKKVCIDNLNPKSVKQLTSTFQGLECSLLKIDQLDLSGVLDISAIFRNAAIQKIAIGNVVRSDVKDISDMCHTARIHSDLDLSWLGKVYDFSDAFDFCILAGELNLSGVVFDVEYLDNKLLYCNESIELFTGARIHTLNLVGTDFGKLEYRHGSMFNGLQVDTIKVRKGDTAIANFIKQHAKSVRKIIEI